MAEWITMEQEIYALVEEHKRIQEENNGVKWHQHIFDTSVRDSESLVNETAEAFACLQREAPVLKQINTKSIAYIDSLLSQGDDLHYDLLIEFINQDWIQGVFQFSIELRVVFLFTQIYQKEMEQNSSFCIFRERLNVKELERLYRTFTFYFRRIDMDFPLELQEEIFMTIQREKLSLTAIGQFLLQTRYVNIQKVEMHFNEMVRRR